MRRTMLPRLRPSLLRSTGSWPDARPARGKIRSALAATRSLDRVRTNDVYRHSEGFLDELRHRCDRLRRDRRVAHRAANVEVRRDQFTRARTEAFSDQRDVVQDPIHRVERKHADLHVERAPAELNAAVRRDIHHRPLQPEIIRVEEPALALEIGDDRFERDSIDTRVGNLRAQPILDVDKTEQARKQGKLVEGYVSDRNRYVAGKSFEEVCVG